ncbi:MAG TPA: hypothetical protein PKD54_03245 [Pirellulaceae bacterium]|nr:hypothetical protein [Pirellulaceae bacterium]
MTAVTDVTQQRITTIALTNASGVMSVMNYLGNRRDWSTWANRYTYTGREWDESFKSSISELDGMNPS